MSALSPAVIVGIDGSRAAIRAAEWAVEEAVSRDVPLQLMFVIDTTEPRDLTDGVEREFARISLQFAQEAVAATGRPVKIETDIMEGRLVPTLIHLSRSAQLMCLGSLGIGYFSGKLLGSVASELARHAHCPVAIIRAEENAMAGKCVVAVVDDAPDRDDVIETAVQEALLRNTDVLAMRVWRHPLGAFLSGDELAEKYRQTYDELEARLVGVRKRHPDAVIDSVAVRGSVNEWLATSTAAVSLIVIGSDRSEDAPRLIGPVGHAVLHHANCSVLVVR